MKSLSRFSRLLPMLLVMALPTARAATVFTTDTLIGVNDMTFEGQDLVVSNAVLSVDGLHGFNSLRVAAGASLTHSASANGLVPVVVTTTNEARQITETNAVLLARPNLILSTIKVMDTNSLVTYTNELDYVVTNAGVFTTLQRTTNSLIAESDTVLVTYDHTNTVVSGMNLAVTKDFELEPGASVNVDGRGFGGGLGTGSGRSAGNPLSGGGAGNGGYGGQSSSNAAGGMVYGSPFEPASLGSGGGRGLGGSGGAGGGKVQLTVGGNCALNGLVTANGQNATNSRTGGGAGGSIWIKAQTISGTGILRARGGAGEPVHGGGGGGGRIALDSLTNVFAGDIVTFGGAGWQRGGAGTLHVTDGTSSRLTIDNGGFAGAATPLNLTSGNSTLELRGRAAAVVLSPAVQNIRSLVVRSNSSLTAGSHDFGVTLHLSITGDAVIEAGAVITLAGKGYPANQGPGLGQSGSVGAGSGHGGYGGRGQSGTVATAGGNYYGSLTAPTLLGSGGRTVGNFPGGAGGGAIAITVTGNLKLDGMISADATAASGNLSGGASGGSVWLTLGGFSGRGVISANGGAGGLPGGGGGGGGRIAVTYSSNSFTGTMTAHGGLGAVAGGAGTIYTKLNLSVFADLHVDNGGLVGTNTPTDLTSMGNLEITGGAVVRPVFSSLSLQSLTVGGNSTLLLGTGSVTVASNAVVAVGGCISGDGLGYGAFNGPGSGLTSTSGSSGGGHGGYGGRGAGATSGGNAYGSTANPSQAGSGGGDRTSLIGGAGGAAFHLTVNGTLILDGRLSAHGNSPSTNNAGGGAGGSLWLTLNRFAGMGQISADGGNGHLPNGGGGGGGRIAVYWNSNSFAGTYSAKGGNGFVPGGAGTIYLKANNAQLPSLIFDNGGLMGTNTVLDVPSLMNLTLRSGASVTSSIASLTILSNLTIGSTATLGVGSMTLSSGTANIASGGRLRADGTSSSGSGLGQFHQQGSGGGGHGGYGGRGFGNSGNGGNVYDSTASPSQSGSRGGFLNSTYSAPGGGYLRLTVSGPLIVDGVISASGSGAVTNADGGGSGGSVWLTLSQFSGSGSISANGGSGQLPNGGGGGGGRIAVTWISNAFTGTYSAKGGNGFQAGGAGTIYLKRNNAQLPSLVVDNGGLSGTNTVLDVFSLSNLTVASGAVLRPISASTLNLTSLNIASNGTLLASTLNISGPANVAAGGGISADGQGFPSGNGVLGGAGVSATGGSGGGGHAGYGGKGMGIAPVGGSGSGGNAYGSLANPTQAGSGGGGFGSSGGTGGGTIRITATGPFTLDGRISANGLHSVSNNSGGGAGGSVILDVSRATLLGIGAITADGGRGHLPNGGGGGGGRIAVIYNYSGAGNNLTNGFLGTFSAKGGSGFVKGGAGTVYLRTNNSNIAQVLVDNGGTRGTNTFVAGSGIYDLTVMGGAVAVNLGNPRDVWVRSNGWLAPFLQLQTTPLTVSRDATFDAGGGIDLDGLGNSIRGIGASFTTLKGGGGHGGSGALNPRYGGNPYDSASSPTQSGSAGGNGSGSTGFGPYGGAGGGVAQLVVGRSLQLDGEISADGRHGEFNSGGGSGGGLRLQAVTIAGNGRITAIGGNGNGTAGGGGGGRIAIYYTTNLFTGTVSACGGSGGQAGGAGTIFFRDNLRSVSSLLLDNCGLAGASTPFSATFGLATNLFVSGGAVAEAQGVIPVFSNLTVTTGGSVTMRRAEANLYLALLGNLTVGKASGLIVDGKGFARTTGLGAGTSLSNQGAGGGYGGAGGPSASEATGGMAYGSPTRPTDRGSGGGGGSGSLASGSEGGGAIRLAVAGTVALDGVIAANGAAGAQDDSGGGSGGSIWITASKLTGHGVIEAMGGDGELYRGGGGGGGRIAVYSPMNTFTGLVSVAGGNGAMVGETGTIFTSGSLGGLEVISQTPIGVVSDVVREVLLTFDAPIDPLSLTADDVVIHTPYGVLDTYSNLSLSLPAPGTLRISFGAQSVSGDYRIEVGPGLTDLFAIPMSQVYTGAYRVMLPTISGRVTDPSGQPVTGVKLLASGVFSSATTDTNGNYSLGVPVNWSGTVTPVLDGFAFVPGGRSYTNISADVTNQNFQMVASLAPSLQVTGGGTNLLLTWNAYSGVAYQVFASTNLMDWVAFDSPIVGTNGLMQLVLPISDEPQKFFRVRAQN